MEEQIRTNETNKKDIPLPGLDSKSTTMFRDRLEDILKPSSSPKEIVENMVKAALEVEFGPSLSLAPGFPKMVKTLAESIVINPDLRRQALGVASVYLDKKSKPKQNNKE